MNKVSGNFEVKTRKCTVGYVKSKVKCRRVKSWFLENEIKYLVQSLNNEERKSK